MSKSKNNGVDPQDLIEKYGADTARLYTMFTAPPEATLEWNDAALEGSYRFLRRVWNFGHKLGAGSAAPAAAGAAPASARRPRRCACEIHTVLRQVDYDYQRMQYNTVVSGAMKLLNALEDFKGADEAGADAAVREGFGILLRVLYPVTPHVAQALWQQLGYAQPHGDLLDAPWPQVDEPALVQDEIELVLQVNGKHRGSVPVPAGPARQEIEKLARGQRGLRQARRRRGAEEGDRGAGPPGQRGGLMKRSAAVLVAGGRRPLLLAGCGFQLRQAPDFAFNSITVSAPRQLAAGQRTAAQHRRRRQRAGGRRARRDTAQVVLDVLAEQREKVVVGLNASGQVREFQLRTRLSSGCARRRARS